MNFTYRKHFERNPGICGGETVIRGTRVLLRTILADLAAGVSVAQILRDYPTLTEEDIKAAIRFAADAAHDDMPLAVTPNIR